MIVHHYYPERMNIGDSFIRDGIAKLLQGLRPGCQIVHFPVNQPRGGSAPFGLQGINLERSNAEADLVVIGGSNLYECRRSGRWGVSTDVQSIQALRKPVLLIGLGSGTRFAGQGVAPSQRSMDEIKLLNERAVGSSVRDTGTFEFLRGLGVGKHVLTGCPATFLFDRPLRYNDNKTVLISFPTIRHRKRRLFYWRVLRTVRKYCRHCLDLGLQPVLVSHHEMDNNLAAGMAGNGTGFFHSQDTRDYYDLYERARWVVAFRLHSAILSLSMGIPFIPVSFDMRAQAFAATYESSAWLVDATRWGLYRRLEERTAVLLAQDMAPFQRFLAVKDRLRGVMSKFLETSLAGIGTAPKDDPGSRPLIAANSVGAVDAAKKRL